jgi:Zn-finger nucleic acid-binding protein
MKAITIGSSHLRQCAKCEGLWADVDTFQRICTEQEKQAAVMGMPAPPAGPAGLEPVHYVPCPVCQQLMNRVNFAGCSCVIVDVCKAHGTWFDKDELRRVVEFIHAGGLEKSRAHQLTQIEDEQRRLQAMKTAGVALSFQQTPVEAHDGPVEIVTDLLRFLMK